MLNIEFLYWIPGPCIFIIRTELDRGKYLLHAYIDIGGHSTKRRTMPAGRQLGLCMVLTLNYRQTYILEKARFRDCRKRS
mgnify:CR=1 FL=1